MALLQLARSQSLAAQTVHQFSSIKVLPDKTISLSLTGSVDSVFRASYELYDLYVLEASTNLVNWTPLATLQSTNTSPNLPIYLDTEAANLPSRFYRVFTNHLITPYPKPTGPYPVGRVSRLLTDSSRTNRYGVPTNSSFMVTLWYPAAATAGVLPGSYLDEQVIAPLDRFYSLGDTGRMRLTNFHAHALPGVPIARNETKYPVVIYSHGSIGHRAENTDKAENLASHGHIVVGIDHAGVVASVFSDGTVMYYSPTLIASSVTDPQVITNFQVKVRDVQFVMNELGRLNENDPLFAGRIDQERIGIFGWSFGGATAVEICHIDSRCRAGVSLDGGPYTVLSADSFDKPFMIAEGGDNSPIATRDGPTLKALFDRLNRDAFWFKLRGAFHGDFADPALVLTTRAAADERYAAILRTYVVSFFNKYLKDHDDHLLDGPLPDYPEIEGYSKK